MLSYLTVFAVSFTIALSGALMPGPMLTTVIAESSRHGFKSGPLICIGHAVLEAAMIALILLGLASFIDNRSVMNVITVTGSLILLYFGISMIASLPKLSLNEKPAPRRSSQLVMLGITVSASNPYWSLWWLTIGLGFVLTAQKKGLAAVGVFFIGHILADFAWYSLISYVIGKGRRFISQKLYRGIILACGCALVAFSLLFAASVFKAS